MTPNLVKLSTARHHPSNVRRPLVIALALLLIAALAGALFWWFDTPAVDITLQTYTTHRAQQAPVIDGKLDDAAWANATKSRAFVLSDGSAEAPLECTAMITWDDEALYVAWDAVDYDIISPHQKRDEPLYTKDVVEIFLDPLGDGKNYYEFEVSPRGVLFDALFPSYRQDLPRSQRWNAPGLVAATEVYGFPDDGKPDTRWTAELKIPWRAIEHAPHVPPRIGDRWAMNLFRIDVHSEGGHFTAWTPPIKGDFHTLDRFGTLVFSE